MQAPFNSRFAAEDAYYGEESDTSPDFTTTDDRDGEDGGDSEEWHDPERQDGLAPDWVLASQDHRTEDIRRWFVLRTRDDELEFIKPGGGVAVIEPGTPMGEAPHYDTEQGARDAHTEWADENPEESDDEGDEWGEWQRVQQIKDWWLFARQHRESDDVQFIAAGKTQDEATVYLAPGGEVRADPHIYDGIEDIQQAIQAYYERESAGDVPDDRQPTGQAPPVEEIEEGAEDAAGIGGEIGNFVRDNPLIVAAVGGGVAYLVQTGEIDLPDGGDINV